MSSALELALISEILELRAHIAILEETVRKHVDAAKEFQNGGVYCELSGLRLGDSIVVGGLRWLITEYERLMYANRILQEQLLEAALQPQPEIAAGRINNNSIPAPESVVDTSSRNVKPANCADCALCTPDRLCNYHRNARDEGEDSGLSPYFGAMGGA